MVVRHHRARVVTQPLHTLHDDAITFSHFSHAHQITVIRIAVDTDWHFKLHPIVDFVGLHLAQIPSDARTAQHGPCEPERLGTLWIHHTNADQTLLPDSVIGQERLVLIHTGGETIGKVFDEVQQGA